MFDDIADQLSTIANQTTAQWPELLWVIGLPWAMFILTKLSGNRLLYLGIIPRHLLGLPGIILSPLLHANFNHLFFNSIPLLIFANFLLLWGVPFFLKLTVILTLLSGAMVWLFAKPGIHVGASGLITAYWAYLIMSLPTMPLVMALVIGVTTIYYFGGIFIGIFPGEKGVSWEGHLFGFLSGVGVFYTDIMNVII